LIDEEDVAVTLTHLGYIKRVPENTYKAQRRGGKGIVGLTTRDSDFVKDLIITSTHDYLMFFTDLGKVYKIKAYEIPEASRTAKGTPVINFLNLDQGERVTAVIPVKEFADDNYLIMVTRNGTIKKTPMSQFDTNRKTGLIAITLKDDDKLISVSQSSGEESVYVVTKKGKSITFHEDDVRSMGRSAGGGGPDTPHPEAPAGSANARWTSNIPKWITARIAASTCLTAATTATHGKARSTATASIAAPQPVQTIPTINKHLQAV